MTDHAKNDWIADHLRDLDDRAEWEAQRNQDLGLADIRPSRDTMIARLAAERTKAQATDHLVAWELRRERWVADLAIRRQEGAA